MMARSLPALLSVLSASLLALQACSGTAGSTVTQPDGSTCTFSGAPSTPSAGTGTSVEAQATAAQLQVLDTLIGSYLRGDSVAYRGTFQADDDYTGHDLPVTIANGPGMASLVAASGQATLTLRSPAQTYLSITQAESNTSLTQVGLILGDDTYDGEMASCTGCLTNLFKSPDTISLDNVSAADDTSVTATFNMIDITVSTKGSLTRILPCELDLSDLIAIAPLETSPQFIVSGNEMVWHVSSSVTTSFTPSAPGVVGGCATSTPYTIDLYVSSANLGDYGVRNFVPGAPMQECTG
jgi:hypothetical protein